MGTWLASLAGVALLLWSSSAMAQWDPKAFGKTLGEAEKSYLEGNYVEAGQKYSALRAMLGDALTSGTIPEAQRQRASETLLVIGYQLARCHQQTGDCESAADVYDDILSGSGLADDLRAKLLVRGAESRACLAEQAITAGDGDGARRQMDKATKLLTDAVEKPFAGILNEEQAKELDGVVAETTAKLDHVETQRKAAVVATVEAKIQSKDCAGAESALAGLAAQGIDQTEQTRLRSELDVACPPVQPEPEGMDMSYVALGVAGVGGALIVTAVILEAIGGGDIDDFEAARTDCLDGAVQNCQTALDLKSDIESQQVITGVLVGVGVAALAGGMVWWWLEQDDSTDEAQVMLTPALSADSVGTQLTVRW